MQLNVRLAKPNETLALRTRYRAELNCQIVHDSIHRREGWTVSYLLQSSDRWIGFGSVALAGPWKDKPTLFEFYLLPGYHSEAFRLFESFLEASRPGFFEVQTNDLLLTSLALAYGRDIQTEKIVFRDEKVTHHSSNGATLSAIIEPTDVAEAIVQRQGGGEWVLELSGSEIGKGGILFHYNPPYGDIYMEIAEPYRKQGFGSYLVQELKRKAYELGAIPAARCDPTNTGSRQTLSRAGFAPFAHILNGSIR